jgi:hypothetical protein
MSKKKQRETAPAEGPPDDFCKWWNPSGTDELSGASIGGHPEAERIWARKDPGRWLRRRYGIDARRAWLAQPYRSEYNAWVEAGRPETEEPFVSIALPLAEQVQRWKEIRLKLAQIAKPMPRLRHRDLQREQLAAGQDPTIAEPIDFDAREVSDE